MTSNKKTVFHPGMYIKEAIEEMGISQNEFSCRCGLEPAYVFALLDGGSDITDETARKLAAFFGTSSEGWINLQARFDFAKA